MPHKYRALIVDDEPRLLSALRRQFNEEFDIITALNGHEALRVIEKDQATSKTIAVIVADMTMPEMDGISLLRTVRRMAPAIRRLMLTGNADQATAIAAINDGQVMRFLTKPCPSSTIADALRFAINDFAFQSEPSLLVPPDNDIQHSADVSIFAEAHNAVLAQLEKILAEASNKGGSDDTNSDEKLRRVKTDASIAHDHLQRLAAYMRLTSRTTGQELGSSCNAIDIITKAIDAFRSDAIRKDVTVSFEPDGERLDICADAGDFAIAVNEVLRDALLRTHSSGHISVTIKKNPHAVAFRFLDTGARSSDLGPLSQKSAPHSTSEKHLATTSAANIQQALASAVAAHYGGAFRIANYENVGVSSTIVLPRPSARALQQRIRN